ncbi:hypothetical protein FOF72_05865 [Lactobacillus jensenii]|nr:hypothetical protein [Lactobacillus jensenii]NIB71392.1 hypothetical protein [Lactobacillus jensenii]TVU94908.1 hypothetical protein FOF72_05865 [Lactobacillus jensenii]
MKILSVSTATNFLTISLNEDEKVIKQVEEKDQRNHSEHLRQRMISYEKSKNRIQEMEGETN